MARRYWLPAVIAMVLLISSGAFAAKANHTIAAGATKPVQDAPVAGGAEDQFGATDRIPAQPTAMGFRGPEDRFVGYKVGSTWYDYQHNGTMGRQIAQGADGRIHFVWTHKPDGTASTANRSVYYASVLYSGGEWVPSHDSSGTQISSLRGGFCNVGVWANRAVVAWHEGITTDTYSSYSGTDFCSGCASFTTSTMPVDYTCSGDESNDDDEPFNYLWPIIAVDETGSGSDPVIMAVTVESVSDPGDEQSLVYFRGTGNPTDYGSCGLFIDSVTSVSPLVRQDPNSDEVAMAWLRPRGSESDYNQFNNDLMVMYSSNNGLTWGAPLNVTNYDASAPNRPYSDLTGMYSSDGCFHLVWSSLPYDEAGGTYAQLGNLEHWDDCNNCFSMLISTDNFNPNCDGPGRWNANVAKPNLAECDGKLYCTYTYFKDDENMPDCSAGGWANGELYVQVSSTAGETWGPPVNLSNTPDNSCAAGDCESEHWASTVMYGDSLYIFYVGDTDAGGWAAGSSGSEGTGQEDPMMFYVHECFEMTSFVELTASPSSIGYPFHTAAGTQVDTVVQLWNTGNTTANFMTSISYTSGSGWLNVAPGSGSIGVGCANSQDLTLTATGPSPEGLYEATITINYGSGTQDIDVELYSFDPFCLPVHVRLRTGTCLLSVAQESRTANQVDDAGLAFFVDTTNYLFDGGLVLSNPNTGSWDFNIFHSLTQQPTLANPWRPLYTTDCGPIVDTTCSSSSGYRFVGGSGVNSDSTIAFTVGWYAPCHPDSATFMIGHFEFGPGPNFTGTLNNVKIAYACDWDVPSDSSSDNRGFVDANEQVLYQRGLYPGSADFNDMRSAGLAYRGHTDANEYAAGGEIWDSPRYVYPNSGYHVDSLTARLSGLSGWNVNVPDSSSNGEDLSAILVIDNNATITDAKATNPAFNLVFWGINPNELSSPQNYTDILRRAEQFICDHISPDAPFCGPQYVCGDANGDQVISITDAVYLIQYIFSNGPAPNPEEAGDADNCGSITIADAKVILCYIFGGGPAPCSPLISCFQPNPGNNYVKLDCPVTVDNPDGDSVGVVVRVKNDVPMASLSVGLHYNSSYVEVSSVDFSNSILPDDFYRLSKISHSDNTVLIGWANLCEYLQPQTDGELAKLWFQIPPTTPTHDVDIDSMFVPPAGTFEFSANAGSVSPGYLDCGSADIIITNDVDTCLVQSPGDTDNDGDIDGDDLAYLISFLYGSGPAPTPLANGDPTGDCCIDSADIVMLDEFVNSGGDAPVECTCVQPGILCHDVCGNSFTDPVFIVCPGGDAEFEVHLRDECNDPVPWVNSVWVELYSCDGMEFCADQPPLDSIPPLGPSDAAGVLRFVYAGGGCDAACMAVVKIPNGRCDIAAVPVISYDSNGDLGVGVTDFVHGSECCDYNGNGRDDDQDFEYFNEHLGHYCGLTECERFSSEFKLTPETNHFPGLTVKLDLILTNSNFDSCFVGLVEFFYSPTGSGQNKVWFHSEMYNQAMAPGEEDTISTQYVVPSSGAGCLYVEFETDCCSTLVTKESCLEYEWHCAADTTYRYEFFIFMSGIPAVVGIDTVMTYLNENWPPLEVVHWPATIPFSEPDYIQYAISTGEPLEISAISKMFTYVYLEGVAQPEVYRNAVVITDQTGDCNGDCLINITDVVCIISYIFSGGDPCNPYRAGDANCDGIVNITDAVFLIQYIFGGGPPPCIINPYFD